MSETEPIKFFNPRHANPAFLSVAEYLLYRGTDSTAPAEYSIEEFQALLAISDLGPEPIPATGLDNHQYRRGLLEAHNIHLALLSTLGNVTGQQVIEPQKYSAAEFYSRLKNNVRQTMRQASATEVMARGWFYILHKFLDKPGYEEYFQSLPDKRKIHEAVRLLRRDEFAQFYNNLEMGIGMVAMFSRDDEAFPLIDDHVNWGYQSVEQAIANGSAIARATNSTPLNNFISIREIEARQMQANIDAGIFEENILAEKTRELAVFKNDTSLIKPSIRRALHFNRLYPADSALRQSALSMLGVPENFPYFTPESFDVKMIDIVLKYFAHLNAPTDLMLSK